MMTRVLGLGYVWIGALCIVQYEDAADWEREAAVMGPIYQAGAELEVPCAGRGGWSGLLRGEVHVC